MEAHTSNQLLLINPDTALVDANLSKAIEFRRIRGKTYTLTRLLAKAWFSPFISDDDEVMQEECGVNVSVVLENTAASDEEIWRELKRLHGLAINGIRILFLVVFILVVYR